MSLISSSSKSSSGGSNGNTSEDSELTIPKVIEYNYDCLGTDLLNEASALESDLINMTGIEVTVEDSVVYLMGRVKRINGEKATAIASRTSGVRSVVKVFEYVD